MQRYWLWLFVPLILSFCGCAGNSDWRRIEGSVWNTTYHITYQSPTDLSDSVTAVLAAVDRSLNMFNPQSTLSRLNRNEIEEVDTPLAHVIGLSLRLQPLTRGRFNPMVRPLVELWGFGTDKERRQEGSEPTQAEIDSVLPLVKDFDFLFDGKRVQKRYPGQSFDFNAIAKGYACDAVADMLVGQGVANCMVEIGGEIAVRGRNPHGELWRVQIDAPVEQADTIVHQRARVVEVTDCGVATSGNYRNWRATQQSGHVGHTISPFTGRPYQSEILSATVVASTCAEADALATASMASPSVEEAEEMLGAIPSVRYLLIAARGDSLAVFASPGL